MRSEFPEYKRWQHAMRPEDTGLREGLAGIPSASDERSHFETKVRDALASRLGVVRNNFNDEEQRLWGRYAALSAAVNRLKESTSSEANALALRDPVLSTRTAAAAIAVSTFLLVPPLWHMLHGGSGALDAEWAFVLAAVGAVALGGLAAFCGSMMRQRVYTALRVAGAVVLALAVATVLRSAVLAGPGLKDAVLQLVIGTALVALLLCIATLAFLATADDPFLARRLKRLDSLRGELLAVRAAREENRRYHLEIAQRHVELARQMITNYRQANAQVRPADRPAPPFFCQPPAIEDAAEAGFKLFGTNE